MQGSNRKFQLFIIGIGIAFQCLSQSRTLTGIVRDKQSDEPIPFASAQLKLYNRGALTDSLGKFSLRVDNWLNNDSLIISSVGYKNARIPLTYIKDSNFIVIKLDLLPTAYEAVVKSKYNRALWFWRKIMKNKPINDRTKWDNYSYEIYNKLEVDLDNVNKTKLAKNAILKPLNFVLVYVDSTSEEKPFLPVYLTETLSDYYFQKNPHKVKEIIKATKTNGIDNESVIKNLGGMYQNVNVYNNVIPVFDKQFISPFNQNGDNYYNFKLLDTQYLNKKRLVHFKFTPKRKGEDVFEGDCWVHDTTFAIQKITLRPSVDANINFIGGLSIIQEYKLINDTAWFLYKDKFVADITPLGNNKIALKGRKTATYKNVVVNSDSTIKILNKNRIQEEVDLASNVLDKPDSFWAKNRHEDLNKSEATVYKVLDTLEKNPTYIHYRNAVNFVATGTKDIGNVRIGPWYYWLTANNWEGTRVRFDVATNYGFNKHLYLHGYCAYGFKDAVWKGKFDVKYLFSREPWSYVQFSYKNDLDNGQVYYDQLGTDNIFAYLFRRPNIPFKFQKIEETKLEYYQETNSGFHFGISASTRQFQALENLPSKEFFSTKSNTALKSFEATIRLRYAFLERFIEDNFLRVSLGSDRPIVELRLTHGFEGILNTAYEFNKIDFSLSDYLKIAPYGTIYYNFFGGKVFNTLPYHFLDILPGNEQYYYSKYSFNLMRRFEFLTDQYAGFNVEHNIGNGLFKFIPLTRKWKFRQFWSAKGIVGNLSDANKQLNFVGNYPFHSLDGKTYLELGTGVDNIFKLFRIDLIWRVAPTTIDNDPANKFGIFGSFRLSF
jgi:hypothetical protein